MSLISPVSSELGRTMFMANLLLPTSMSGMASAPDVADIEGGREKGREGGKGGVKRKGEQGEQGRGGREEKRRGEEWERRDGEVCSPSLLAPPLVKMNMVMHVEKQN